MSKKSEYIIVPGETICELLGENNMTQIDLAAKIGLAPKTINEIIKGKASISTETALKLEYVFGLPASFWNSLESSYREKVLRQKEYDTLLEETKYLNDIPYNEMVKRNWLEKTKDPIEKIINLRRFFSVASLSFNTELKNKMAFRKSDNKNFSFNALYCWIRYGEKQISNNDNDVADFDIDKLKIIIPEIRKYSDKSFLEYYDKIKQILSSVGITLVYEPCLPKTYVNGVTYKPMPNKALIMLSGRNKRDDSLWFTFFHEIGHLLNHSKKEIFIDYDTENDNQIEIEADNFSKNILIPQKLYYQFLANEDFSDEAIISFAKDINVNGGIVVGRLQSDGVIEWSKHNNLKIIYK